MTPPEVVAVRLETFKFAVGVTFPGNRRKEVQAIVNALVKFLPDEDRVFYDEFYEPQLAVKNLDTLLQGIYERAELVAVFIDAEYEKRDWCKLEWRQVRDILATDREDRVIPLTFDGSLPKGLYNSIDGRIDLRGRTPAEVAGFIKSRLESGRVGLRPDTPPPPRKLTPEEIQDLLQTALKPGTNFGALMKRLNAELKDSAVSSKADDSPVSELLALIHRWNNAGKSDRLLKALDSAGSQESAPPGQEAPLP